MFAQYCKSRIFRMHVIFVYFVRGGFRTKIKCMRKLKSKSENLQRPATVRKFHAYERLESPGYENWVRTKYSGFTVLAVFFSTRLFGYVLLYLGHCAVATVAVCGFGSWSLVFDCGMPRQISPLPPTPSQTEVCSMITMGESIHTSKTVVFFTIQRSPRISTSYKFAAPRYRLPCRLFRWASNLNFQRHWKIAQSCRNHKDKVSARLRYHVSNSVVFVHRTMGESISTIQRSPRISTSYKFAAPRYRLPPMALQTVQVSRSNLACQWHWKIAQSCRKVVPKSLPVSATTFPTALSFYIAQGRLRKDSDICPPSCSQRQNRCHLKRK